MASKQHKVVIFKVASSTDGGPFKTSYRWKRFANNGTQIAGSHKPFRSPSEAYANAVTVNAEPYTITEDY